RAIKAKVDYISIEDCYEIFVNTTANGIIYLEIDGKKYYEENSGCLSSEKNFAKIRIKQTLLNKAKKYTVVFRKTVDRLAYFSVFEDAKSQEFSFKPLTKRKNINVYHVADVHNEYENALKTCGFFGNKLDLLIVNGDIGEVETVEHYEEVVHFVGELSKGYIPVIFARGNHDARGKLAEKFTDYFPSNGKKTYFTFNVGCFSGIVMDVGEDKVDNFMVEDYAEKGFSHPDVYNGTNIFHEYRQEELEFLKGLKPIKNKIAFAVSHIPPAKPTDDSGCVFDIERDCYKKMNDELQRIGIKFMLSGHFHRAFILKPLKKSSFIEHNYPIIVGSHLFKDDYYGTALIVNKDEMKVMFTGTEQTAKVSETLKI
ncbi:MAG: metallophosphoesterase, partial [Clostridia bacterium]|nr:metallophosphoesterase [Clostridia bacterium]